MSAHARNNLGLWRIIFRLAFTVFLLVLVTACSVSTTVIFANATNYSVSIYFKDDNHKIAVLFVAPNSSVEIKHLLDDRFSIRTTESIMEYERQVVPGTYIEDISFGPFFKRVVKAQLENDGCVYLLSKNDDIPNRRHEVQPPDFPLCPRVSAIPTTGHMDAKQ